MSRRSVVQDGFLGRGGRGGLGVVLAVLVALAAVVLPDGVAEGATDPDGGPRVLVFTKTAAYSHASTPHAVAVLRALGDEHGFAVDDTADAGVFTTTSLARYEAVVWLSTTGDVLNGAQQAAFEGFIRAGGGYVGVHAASHTEHDWPWYGQLLGAWFGGVDEQVQPATIHVEDQVHPSTAMLPATWVRTDEWYDFEANPRGQVHVLATLDEDTYGGGTMGADHPIAWCRGFDGGRSWYTGGGHADAAYDEPLFRDHLLHGVLWAAGLEGGACGDFVTPDPDPGQPGPGPGGPAVLPAGASRFTSTEPIRILDTRIGLSAPAAPVPAGGVVDLDVGGRLGVPVDATAVALTLTATEAQAPGYVTAWPAGAPRPLASSLNVDAPGATVANLVVVPVGDGGRVLLATQEATHLVADVAGWWTPSGATTAGRFVPVQPARLLDTRTGGARVASGGDVVLPVVGRAGVPGAGVAAVALTVTATDTTAAGYVVAWGGGERPLASNLNVPGAGATVPNLVLVPVGPDGAVRLHTQEAAHLVVDVAGWFTDATAAAAGDGLLVPVTPTRFLDTRDDAAAAALAGGVGRELVVAGRAPLPGSGVAAVVANLTATGTSAPGFVTVHPAGSALPEASHLNVSHAGQTVANLALAPLGAGGRLVLHSQERLDLVVDVAGWFTGTPVAAA